MNAAEIITSALTLIAGVGIFLIACYAMSGSLQALGGDRLKSLLGKMSNNKLAGVGMGAAATAVIQSSGAATVMVISLVNAGIMTLTQAATAIYGANIGTTVTGILVAVGLLGGELSPAVVFAAFTGIGAGMLTFAKSDRAKSIGGLIAGFGMLFVGLSMMSGSMSRLSELHALNDLLATFRTPALLVLIGALFTAIVQSSSVMSSIAITMTVTGLITLDQGIYLTMGANIGTCVTALLVGVASTQNAKRTALIHLLFNTIGAAVFLAIGGILHVCGTGYGALLSALFPRAPQLRLAVFHTVFNIITTIIVLPFTTHLIKLVTKLAPDRSGASAVT